MASRSEEKSFKSSMMGGFRRQDVINYIEQLVREHREEVDAYRSGADLLRIERDEARQELARVKAAQSESAAAPAQDLEPMHRQLSELAGRWEQERKNVARLEEELSALRESAEKERVAAEDRVLTERQASASQHRQALSALEQRHEEDQSKIARLSVELARLQSSDTSSAQDLAEKDKRIAELQNHLQTTGQAVQAQLLEKDRIISDLRAQLAELSIQNASEEAERAARARAKEIENAALARVESLQSSAAARAAEIEQAAHRRAETFEMTIRARVEDMEKAAQRHALEVEQAAHARAEAIESDVQRRVEEKEAALQARADQLDRQAQEQSVRAQQLARLQEENRQQQLQNAGKFSSLDSELTRMRTMLQSIMNQSDETLPDGAAEPVTAPEPPAAEVQYNPFGESSAVGAASPALSETAVDEPMAQPVTYSWINPGLGSSEQAASPSAPEPEPASSSDEKEATPRGSWFVTGYPYYDANAEPPSAE